MSQVVLDNISLIQTEFLSSPFRYSVENIQSDFIATTPSILLVLEEFPDFVPVNSNGATSLGTPIGKLQSINIKISKKCEELTFMADKLIHFIMHDALVLLHHAFVTSETSTDTRQATFISNHDSTIIVSSDPVGKCCICIS